MYVFTFRLWNLSFGTVRACCIKTRHSHGIQESARLVFFFWSLLHLIFRYFIYNRKCTHHSHFVDWGSRGARALDLLLTLALYFRLRSSWRFKLPGPDFTNRFVNPFIMFTFHRGLRIRIIRPRNRTALTQSTIRHIYFAYCTHVWLVRSNDQNR